MARIFLTQRLKSFRHAFRGIRLLIATQRNAQAHALATLVVIILGMKMGIGWGDWALLAVAIGMVWMAEAFNTALEFLGDEIALERRERIGKAKDLAAGAVLFTAICAVAIGAFVFIPHLTPIMEGK